MTEPTIEDKELIEYLHRLLALLETPEYGLFTWQAFVLSDMHVLADILASRGVHAEERPRGTPVNR